MSSFTSQNTRRRSGLSHAPPRRPLTRSNSSLLGTIKNIVTAPLTWFAAPDDFDDAADLKGKRRRHATARSPTAMDDGEGPPRSKRLRVQSPDSQIQFHPEPQYAPSYPNPPAAYLDPPEMAFTKSPSRLTPAQPSNINQLNTTRSLFRTMSIDPPAPLSRESSMNFTPFERDNSMERAASAVPRDLSMPLPTTRNPIRLRSSITPQPSIAREVSEPPPFSVLAQKPVFVRAPTETHQRLSSQSSTSTLGSLVDSRRRTRSPMRQHSSLLFGSGSQEHEASTSARQPAAAERALHELDVYRTPLLPTRSRLRATTATAMDISGDQADLFRSRRRSQLLLMRDDRQSSRLGRKDPDEYPFLEAEKPMEKETKKVNETKPYAGEGGMKKLLARRMKEVEDEEVEATNKSPPKPAVAELPKAAEPKPSVPPPLPPMSSSFDVAPSAQAGSSLRVGRAKTSRNHFVRPARPTKKFSAAYEEELDDSMEDAEELERQRERQALEEAAKNVPTFDVPAGFSFAKEPNAKPPIAEESNAKEPPISALPFSFAKPAVVAARAPVVPSLVPKEVSVVEPAKLLAAPFSFAAQPTAPIAHEPVPDEKPSGSVPNFFGSSKLRSQAASSSSLTPPAIPSLGTVPPIPALGPPASTPSLFAQTAPAPEPVVTPKPPAFPSMPPSVTATPIRDTENPFWMGDAAKKEAAQSLFAPKPEPSSSLSLFGGPSFEPASKPASATSLFGAPAAAGFSFNAPPAPVAAVSVEPPKVEEQPKPSVSFALPAAEPEQPHKPAPFAFNTAPSAEAPKPFAFGASSATPAANPFAASAAPAAAPEPPKPAFGGFSFGQPQKEAPKATTAPTFAFGSSVTTESTKPPSTSTPFTFGATSAPASANGFSFGSSAPVTENKPASTGFSFGTPSATGTARPVTPPRNEVPEFKMDESPTREPAKPAETRPSLGSGSGFLFGNSNSGSMFGSAAPTSPPFGSVAPTPTPFGAAPSAPTPTPFTFGSPSSSNPNPFGSASSTTESKPFGSSDFGRPSSSSSTGFPFGQNNATEPPRPSTTGSSFSFGPSTPSAGAFTFGAGAQAPTTATTNPFGGSAPSSPSTFNQPTPSFSFGGPAAPQTTSFAFGSQPASPAGGLSSLPQAAAPGGFGSAPGFGGGGGVGGSSLFTIGAAPPQNPQQRAMKKLPRRKN